MSVALSETKRHPRINGRSIYMWLFVLAFPLIGCRHQETRADTFTYPETLPTHVSTSQGVFTVVRQPIQPDGIVDLYYVSSDRGEMTLFDLALRSKTIWLLMHVYLGGEEVIGDMRIGDRVVMDDKEVRIRDIARYEVVRKDGYSDYFRLREDLSRIDNVPLTVGDVYKSVIDDPGSVVFQTCIKGIDAQGNEDWSWGRLFAFGKFISE